MAEPIEYRDTDGDPCSLDVLCMREPAWAANRIRAERARAEKAEAERDDLKEQNLAQADQIQRLYLHWSNAERPYRSRIHRQRTELNRLNRALGKERKTALKLAQELAEAKADAEKGWAEVTR